MSKFLQSNYKWWYLFNFSLKSATVYRASQAAMLVGNFVSIAGILIVWYANIASGSSLYSFSFIFTYFVLGRLFFDTSEFIKMYALGSDIYGGELNQRLLITQHIWLYHVIRSLGEYFFNFLIEFCFIAIIAILGWQYIIFPTETWQWVCFLVLVLLNIFHNLFLQISLESLYFFFTNAWGFRNLINNFKLLTSGRIFPLDILPQISWFTLSPFAYIYFLPMQIYLGKKDLSQSLWIILGSTLWLVFFYFLATFVYKKGLKQYEAVGL